MTRLNLWTHSRNNYSFWNRKRWGLMVCISLQALAPPCKPIASSQISPFVAALLEQEEKERSQVEHSIGSLQKDMVRLSGLITEKRGQQEKLEQGNILMENDFIHALKVKYQCLSKSMCYNLSHCMQTGGRVRLNTTAKQSRATQRGKGENTQQSCWIWVSRE